jgi:DNA-binding transcriptional regulator YhcF (GntR family)
MKETIFINIADRLCERILNGEYRPEESITSVRELAVEMNVNPNTAMRAIDRLQNFGILYSKKSVGCYISPNAKELIRNMRHANFVDATLPSLFKEMQLLDISIEEVVQAYNQYMSNK